MTDGYGSRELLDLVIEQTKIVHRLSDINEEISNLPKIPKDMESWMDSLPDLYAPASERFKITDLKKLTKLTKEYNKLKLKEESNTTKLRLALIDNALLMTNECLKDKDV